MEISEFNTTVKNKIFRNLYFFCGEEEYLKELYIKRLIDSAVESSARAFNLFIFKEKGGKPPLFFCKEIFQRDFKDLCQSI